ncbi:MAG: TonB-dependent receptor [Caulobacteraceae bacterium]|nr:TonB-dependent receptor [Caulobacteraceae bacterium]
MKNLMAGASLLALLASATSLHAEAAAAAPAPAAPTAGGASEVEEVIVTGTRETGIKAADSPAPIQLVGHQQLLKTGAPDLSNALLASVPSLNLTTQDADSAAVQILAALRGLSPNDTLVLINGKRRHPTSNLAVDPGSPYTGSATTDLSWIPVDAIDHVEVLTDGAAAQYGSDAIGGVVNIILKSNPGGGMLDLTGGRYYNGNVDGQGATGQMSLNKGFNLNDKGFINVTLEERYHDWTTTGIGDRRFTTPNGTAKSGINPDDVGIFTNPTFPYINRLNGDPQYNIYNALVNGAYKITDNIEFYSFDTFGYMESQHFENVRPPNRVTGCTSNFVPVAPFTSCVTGVNGGVFGQSYNVMPFPHGFDPREKFDETDYSITGGFRGEFEGWHWDLSTTWGGNRTDVYVVGSGNAELFPLLQAQSPTPVAPQTRFYDGQYHGTEWTTNFDVNRSFPIGLAAPLNVAFGVEERRETYGIRRGEPASYFGAGAQSFIGYTPLDEGDFSRGNTAVYVDFATDPIKNLHIDLAGRFEHYTDFGSTEVGKATLRYDFNPQFAVRTTISSGFRAPTLAEEYYSGTNVAPSFAFVQLPPNSAAAKLAGFNNLGPELSHNYSVGFVMHPIDRMQITVDAYHIIIRDRILDTGEIYGYCCSPGPGNTLPPLVSQGVVNAITFRGVTLEPGISYAGIELFTNSANTVTNGLEVTANYASDFGDYGHVDWSLGYNWNKTHITELQPLPAVVFSAPLNTSQQSLNAASALTTGTPRNKVILQAYWSLNQWSVNLRGTWWGNSGQFTPTGNPVFIETPGEFLVDLDLGYRINKWVKLDVGANNLFNTKPPPYPNLANGNPIQGGNVFNVPETSAYNPNGGYYYGRVVISF